MDFLSIEAIEKFLSIKDLITASLIFFLVDKKLSPKFSSFKTEMLGHFSRIEKELGSVSKNMGELKVSIVDLEFKQTERINNLSERVSRLEKQPTEG